MIQADANIARAETTGFASEKKASCDPADRHGRRCTGVLVLNAVVHNMTQILQYTMI
mgnify:CR=1 FL=1